MSKKIILLTLQTFSTTGGIQKMTRTLAHSLYHISLEKQWNFKLWSLYDSRYDLMGQYLSAKNFAGFGRSKFRMGMKTLSTATKADVVILSHINLALIGMVIKMLKPKCSLWLVAHGIEVWRPLSFAKRTFLKRYCDKVICVSAFTKSQMFKWHQLDGEKCVVLNNAIDPFIRQPDEFEKPDYLVNRYNLGPANKIIFTLTRLASSEQYKGYEQVIKAVGRLKLRFPGIKYILSGQYDAMEEMRIRDLIRACDVEDEVILTGFLDENELVDHFLLADLFVLPSKKEGFGIVFIEALACGLPVICGNADGSVDAIRNGELGIAINVDSPDELERTIIPYLETPLTVATRESLQSRCLGYFNELNYRKNLLRLINDELTA
ncbi:MAG TPA: glycosyltransferase family 4 protein [Mucilaginibacter sp.]|jgi:glycosyltransferase involved in cell wall biosynthesis|nr:glycosyltransferase family 4 protein [Mucilaginibacter sp.]